MQYSVQLSYYPLFTMILGLITACNSTSQTAIESTELIASNLESRDYCYQLETDAQTTYLRLTVEDSNLSGDSRATIHNEEVSDYTSYSQSFTGTLAGNEANVETTTWIEYDVQNSQETWILTNDTLQTGQKALAIADCSEVNLVFQDINGLEAKDLLAHATTVHEKVIRFAPETSTATVENSVIRGERDLYLLGAGGGQEMTLSISSLENNAVFDVVSPSGYILTVEATEETILLPHNGDYQVIVGGTRGNATYTLTVGINK